MSSKPVMPFKMKNLKSFPMEKLCFNLKLEVLEQMEPREVLELAKVNEGFQGMLVRDPSIVFGEHVHDIELYDEAYLSQYRDSNPIKLNDLSHCSFVKKIRSCNILAFYQYQQLNDQQQQLNDQQQQLNVQHSLLHNLKSVNSLCLGETPKETVKRFFSNFQASIKQEAYLNIEFSEDQDYQMIKDLIENFIMTQLKDSEAFEFSCVSKSKDLFHFYYNTLLKTEIKNISIHIKSDDYIDFIGQQLATNGIPSKNPEALFFLFLGRHCRRMMDLLQYPGIQRIDGSNRPRLLKQANDLMKNTGESINGSEVFDMEFCSMFRRHIDSTKDCIYVYQEVRAFVAFYVPAG